MQQKAQLYTDGYLVIVGLVSPEICAAAAVCIRSKVARTLKKMQVSGAHHFRDMLTADWEHSPNGWTGPPFGMICLRGWQMGPGTGRSGGLSILEI
jgi:hypothetical protein